MPRTTRNQTKRQHESTGEEETKKPRLDSGKQKCVDSVDDNETLADISHEAVGKLLNRFNRRGSRGSKLQESFLNRCDSINKLESGLKEKQTTDNYRISKVTESTSSKEKGEGGIAEQATHDDDQMEEPDWEEGPVNTFRNDHEEGKISSVTIEFEASPDTAKRRAICRASAEDKEQAELVHKVHLLCLLGRGRLIDRACNDPLIQATLLSLVPRQFLKISETSKLTARALAPLVNWFHKYFHVRLLSNTERSFASALALALERQEGTAEEVAALSVALFRALNLTTRFVSVLDVASLKPCVEKNEPITKRAKRTSRGIFNSSTLMVATPDLVSGSPRQYALYDEDNVCETSSRHSFKNYVRKTESTTSQVRDSTPADQLNDYEAHNNMSDVDSTKQYKWPKRIGDLEFQMQLEMAKAATASRNDKIDRRSYLMNLHSNSQNMSFKGMRRFRSLESPTSQGISVAIGSRKVGAPLYWAEVYCSGENLTGKWVHVDAVNAIIDGEQKVEAAVASCKTSLRYAVAFAGNGAKDVTRRYCMKWYKIASERINARWWDAVLAPLKQLELISIENMFMRQEGLNKHEKTEATGMLSQSMLDCASGAAKSLECSVENEFGASRSCLEDLELETRELTEPLPTNQQAYKNHPLYALERWLTKYQILHPRGPILGFCSSHPVYPRACVQVLHTKERWLREGLQLKANELPVKVLKRSPKQNKEQASEADDYDEGDNCGQDTSLYGKWQTEPLQLPRAVDGIVPRNERGQVDVWSEKCLPPGTVHLRLPRLVPIAKRLEIDFAPAMVGFEFRNGRSIPVYEGIVVCTEFKDAILEVYAEEEEKRDAEERKRNESQAISRWYQLLSSIVTRQRLKNRYGDGSASASQSVTYAPNSAPNSSVKSDAQVSDNKDDSEQPSKSQPRNLHVRKENARFPEITDEHEHVFLMDDQTTGDEESSTRIKRCHCGFYIEMEVL